MDWLVCKLHVCNLVFDKFVCADLQKVNEHPKVDANFDIQYQLEQFQYDMNRTLAYFRVRNRRSPWNKRIPGNIR